MVVEVIGGLHPTWTNYLPKTLSGLVMQLLTGLAIEIMIW
jgi:hypothetical protein